MATITPEQEELAIFAALPAKREQRRLLDQEILLMEHRHQQLQSLRRRSTPSQIPVRPLHDSPESVTGDPYTAELRRRFEQ